MRTILFAMAAGAVVSLLDVGAAQAQNYPFCLKTGPGPGDCKYDTYAQCLATASGIYGYCQPNYWLPQNNGASGYGDGRSSRANRTYGPQY
jgi:hypothetical protein